MLSHRWIGQEVVFHDFESISKDQLVKVPLENPMPRTATGAAEHYGRVTSASTYEIAGACGRVRGASPEIRHIWIDTICIDKRDGRELSSVINSMFRWYHNAAVCNVYLYDVTWDAKTNRRECFQQFLQSQWFTRGWTLQELLAPKKLEFLTVHRVQTRHGPPHCSGNGYLHGVSAGRLPSS